jgi:FixJ family two-component response regulator
VGQRPIIHIVDDDESFRTALQSLFRSVGHLTCAHGSVAEFLAAPREDAAGCILLDVRLPGIG